MRPFANPQCSVQGQLLDTFHSLKTTLAWEIGKGSWFSVIFSFLSLLEEEADASWMVPHVSIALGKETWKRQRASNNIFPQQERKEKWKKNGGYSQDRCFWSKGFYFFCVI